MILGTVSIQDPLGPHCNEPIKTHKYKYFRVRSSKCGRWPLLCPWRCGPSSLAPSLVLFSISSLLYFVLSLSLSLVSHAPHSLILTGTKLWGVILSRRSIILNRPSREDSTQLLSWILFAIFLRQRHSSRLFILTLSRLVLAVRRRRGTVGGAGVRGHVDPLWAPPKRLPPPPPAWKRRCACGGGAGVRVVAQPAVDGPSWLPLCD